MAKSKKSSRRSNPRQNFFGLTKSSEPRGQFTVKGTVDGRRFISNEMTFARTVALLGEITSMSTSEVEALVRQADKHGQVAIVDVRSGGSLTIARAAVRANPRRNLFGLFSSRLDSLKGVRFHVGGRESDRRGALPLRLHAVDARTAMRTVEELVGLDQRDAEDVVLEAAKYGRASVDNPVTGGVVSVVVANEMLVQTNTRGARANPKSNRKRNPPLSVGWTYRGYRVVQMFPDHVVLAVPTNRGTDRSVEYVEVGGASAYSVSKGIDEMELLRAMEGMPTFRY